jgi:hypothetical protein
MKDWSLKTVFLKWGRTKARFPKVTTIYPDGKPTLEEYNEPLKDVCILSPLFDGEEWVEYNIQIKRGEEITHKLGDFIVDSNLPFSINYNEKKIAEYKTAFMPIPLFLVHQRIVPIFLGEILVLRMRLIRNDLRGRFMELGYSYFFQGGNYWSGCFIEVLIENKGEKEDEAHYKDKNGNKVVVLHPCFY